MEERASAYSSLFFGSLQLQGVVPDPHAFTAMVLPSYGRQVGGGPLRSPARLPDGGRAEDLRGRRRTWLERIAEIPTGW
jgi:hypothetical protein